MIDEARAAGATIVEPEEGGAVDRETRRMPLTLVVHPPADTAVMREEIFGPIRRSSPTTASTTPSLS
ncbi:hypothetical protein AB5I41_08635 [Sphingomonas sp. MMS24-JH45]